MRAAGVVPIDFQARPVRWAWSDVWRCEGLAHVGHLDWTAMKRPLLRSRELVAKDAGKAWRRGSALTSRRRLASGRGPGVGLSATLRRVRPADLEGAPTFL